MRRRSRMPIADQRAALNAPFTFQVPADTFADIDTDDTLTLSATLANGSPLPAWLHFDPATRTFSGNAPAGSPSIDVKVTATDLAGASVSDTFALAVNQAPAFGPPLTRALGIVSTNAVGEVGDIDSGQVSNPHFTADGRSVIFFANAGNLVPNDINSAAGATDIFLKNLDTGAITLLSTDSNGNHIDNGADGRYMAFTTSAQLAAADTNDWTDVYLKDLVTGQVRLVSHSFGGGAANRVFGADTSLNTSAISADGRYVVFFSDANNLVAGDGGSGTDLFRWDRTTDTITLLSNTVHHNFVSSQWYLSISADARYVTYAALIGGVPHNFVLDTNPGGQLTEINTYGYGGASLSADGRYVAFVRSSVIYRKDLVSGTEVLVSVDLDGNPASGGSNLARISANGRYVAFSSWDDNIVAGDSNGSAHADLFVRDMDTGVTRRVNVTAAGQQVFGSDLGFYDVSNDGEVTFVSNSGDLVPGDTNGTLDVFATNVSIAGGNGTERTVLEVVGAPAAGTQLSASATFTFSDPDASDTHHLVSATGAFNAGASQNAASALGTLTASITHDTTNGTGGELAWSYTVDAALIEYLAPGQTRVEAFDVSLADDFGGVATQTILVTLTGVNDPPTVAHQIADQPATTDSAFAFTFAADTFNDVDGQTLTYTATLASGAPLPSWLQFDPGTRTFSGTPHFGDGRIDVKVTASDGQYTVSDTFRILLPVYNHAPVLAPLAGPGENLTKSGDIGSMETAMVLDGHFGVGDNPNITDATTIPHVSISATSTGAGSIDYYKFTVTAGARAIFDIDGGVDTLIILRDSSGNIVSLNDDYDPVDNGSPANSGSMTYNSFLDYTFTTGGTYYLQVGYYNGPGATTPAVIPAGSTYQLHVSLTSAPSDPVLNPYEANGGAPSGAAGTLVSSLVDLPGNGGHDNVTDPDDGALTGIAVSGVTDASRGAWWYSLDNGAHWDLVGSADEQHALLLAADGGTRIYFQAGSGHFRRHRRRDHVPCLGSVRRHRGSDRRRVDQWREHGVLDRHQHAGHEERQPRAGRPRQDHLPVGCADDRGDAVQLAAVQRHRSGRRHADHHWYIRPHRRDRPVVADPGQHQYRVAQHPVHEHAEQFGIRRRPYWQQLHLHDLGRQRRDVDRHGDRQGAARDQRQQHVDAHRPLCVVLHRSA